MGLFDYSSLKEAGVKAKESVESGGFNPLTEGTFPCSFLKAERTETQGRGGKPKRPMIVTEWKVNCKEDKRMHRETLKIRYIMDLDFQAERFLNLMIELNVDLGMISADGDWDDVFEELFESRAKASWKVYYNDTDKDESGVPKKGAYPEYRLEGIIQGLTDDCEYVDTNHAPTGEIKEAPAEVKPVPEKKVVKKKKKKKVEEPVTEEAVAEEPVAEEASSEPVDADVAAALSGDDDEWD